MTDFDGKDTTTGTLKARKKVCQTFFLAFYLWFSDLRHEKRKFLYRTFVFIVETQNFASLHPSTSQVVPKYFASQGKLFDLGRVCLHYACTMGRTWERLGNVGAGRVLGLGN